MSLIFKALKKLKDQPAGSTEQQPRPKSERHVYTFRKIIFSPLVVVIGICVAIAAGCGALYVLGLIEAVPRHPTAIQKSLARQRVTAPMPDEPGAEATRLPGDRPSTQALDDVPPAPDGLKGDLTAGSPEERWPGVAGATVEPSPKTEVRYIRAAHESVQDAQPQFWPPQTAAPRLASESSVPRARAANDQTAPPSDAGQSVRTVGRAAVTDRGALTPSATPHRPESSQKILHQQMGQQARIAQLVAAIQGSMEREDTGRTMGLLRELEALKGRDNAYVLKLKAYWHLRNGEFEPATMLLNQVLSRNADDLEAGVNMAVAEMKTSQFKAAFDRLSKLRKQYPDNRLIAELLQKLP